MEPRVQSSLEDDEETSITSDNETSQESQTLQNQISYIENIIKTKFENKSSTPPVTTESQYSNLRNNYLSEWERLPFQSSFDTFINENSTQGYGIVTERNSKHF